MTLPITRTLPPVPDFEDLDEAKKYLHDLNFELQNMYEESTQNINGTIRSYADVDGSEWIPTVRGSTVAGTISYRERSAFVLRQGIITEYWFDIRWNGSGGAAGDLYVDLPYKVTHTVRLPFLGAAFSSNLAYPFAAHTAITVAPVRDTYDAVIISYGPGATSAANVGISTMGRIAGSVRYIGVEDE